MTGTQRHSSPAPLHVLISPTVHGSPVSGTQVHTPSSHSLRSPLLQLVGGTTAPSTHWQLEDPGGVHCRVWFASHRWDGLSFGIQRHVVGSPSSAHLRSSVAGLHSVCGTLPAGLQEQPSNLPGGVLGGQSDFWPVGHEQLQTGTPDEAADPRVQVPWNPEGHELGDARHEQASKLAKLPSSSVPDWQVFILVLGQVQLHSSAVPPGAVTQVPSKPLGHCLTPCLADPHEHLLKLARVEFGAGASPEGQVIP